MAKEQAQLKQKKKKWEVIVAPEIFNNELIGETYVADTKAVMGKKLTANLSNITGNIKHQAINLLFEVIDIKEDTAITQILGYAMSPASLKRLMRRNVNRMDSSFLAETADRKVVRVKTLMVTRSKTKGFTIKNLSSEFKKILLIEIKKLTYENLIIALISHGLQSDVRMTLKKIYPLAVLEIKKLNLERELAEGESIVKIDDEPGMEEGKEEEFEEELDESQEKKGREKEEIKGNEERKEKNPDEEMHEKDERLEVEKRQAKPKKAIKNQAQNIE